jgi:splicing factor 3A subunit 1
MEEGSSSGESDEEDDIEQPEDPKFARERAMAASGVAPAPPVGQPPMPPPPPMSGPTAGNVVVKPYDPKEAAALRKKVKDDQYLVSPLTGEKILASKAAEHMKIGLLDSKWVEERDKQITAKAKEDVVFAPGGAIESNLKQLAERRSDIFGVGEGAADETYIGLKVGEEEQKVNEKNTWDGHSSSAEAAARAARKDVSLRDQIDQIHKQKGLIPDKERETRTVTVKPPPPQHHQQPVPPPPQHHQPGPPMQHMVRPLMMGMPVRPAPMLVPQPMFIPQGPGGPSPQQQMFMQQQRPGPPGHGGPRMGGGMPPGPPMADEPPMKRQKTEDNLIPEDRFIRQNPGRVNIMVSVPRVEDKPEWKLNGQVLHLTFPITENISEIKSKINDEIGMPPGKQKLQLESFFLKDAMTLGYYNMVSGVNIQLQLKERGGRKK